jgi:hypothetical protein
MSGVSFRQYVLSDGAADSPLRYEGLPPNFSLSDNMLAGAFAGIAVRPQNPSERVLC